MIVAAPSDCSPNFALPPKFFFSWKLGLLNRSFGLLTPRPQRGIGLARRASKQRYFRGASQDFRGAPLNRDIFAAPHRTSAARPLQFPSFSSAFETSSSLSSSCSSQASIQL